MIEACITHTHTYKFASKLFSSVTVIGILFFFFTFLQICSGCYSFSTVFNICMVLTTWICATHSKTDFKILKTLSLPVLLKFSLWHCSSESLPVSCLQNIHIQSTISTIAIDKEPFMPTCYNFILHTLYRKKVFSLHSSISEALMPCEKNAPFQCRGDMTVPYVNLLYVQLREGLGDLKDLSHL